MSTATKEAIVTGVAGNILTIEAPAGKLMKNEVAYVCLGDERLKAEVLRISGKTAELQVFENTEGIRVGTRVELAGHMLSIALGPGLLGSIYDGLQIPLYDMAEQNGFFLKRGATIYPFDAEQRWVFQPACRVGDQLQAGAVLGTVTEQSIQHQIMVPFDEPGKVEVLEIREGEFRGTDHVARVRDAQGNERPLSMVQQWPVRTPLAGTLLRRRVIERLYPADLMVTTQRMIDTFFPIAKGGTACIPGPFGAGKTVLQGLIARHSSVDVVVLVLCGERAGEVLETIQKSVFVDMVYLQQDGLDEVDASVPLERQKEAFGLVQRLIGHDYKFQDKEQARDYFTHLTGLLKNLNYAPMESEDYNRLQAEIEQLEHTVI